MAPAASCSAGHRAGILQLRGTSDTHIDLVRSSGFGSSTSSIAFHPPNHIVQWDWGTGIVPPHGRQKPGSGGWGTPAAVMPGGVQAPWKAVLSGIHGWGGLGRPGSRTDEQGFYRDDTYCGFTPQCPTKPMGLEVRFKCRLSPNDSHHTYFFKSYSCYKNNIMMTLKKCFNQL